MIVQGDVPLEIVVWLTGSPEALGARAVAMTTPRAEWMLGAGGRFRARFRGTRVDFEQPYNGRWSGLVTGRVEFAERAEQDGAFEPYVHELAAAPPLHLESCWFAVDDDGHVGCFDRQLLGAAPMKRCWGPRPQPSPGTYEPADLAKALADQHAPGDDRAWSYTFLFAPNALAHALAEGAPAGTARRWQVRAQGDLLIASAGYTTSTAEPVADEFVAWLHAGGHCRGCVRSAVSDTRLAGVFVYTSPARNRAAPYDRVAEPIEAFDVTRAAATLGLAPDALLASRLPLRFAAKPRVQPIEYVRCTWSETVPWEGESGERHGGDVSPAR